MKNRALLLGAVAALGLGLACDEPGRAAAPPPAPPAAQTAPAPGAATASQVDVDEIKLGTALNADGSLDGTGDDFKAGDPLFVVLDLGDHTPMSVVQVRWTRADGSTVAESTMPLPEGALSAAFEPQETAGWTAGDYKLEVWVNGKKVADKGFEIERG